MPQQLKSWSIAINTDDATLDDCPPELIKSLMPARPSQKNPFRAAPSKPQEKAPVVAAPVIATPQPGYPYPPTTPFPYYPYVSQYHPAMYQAQRERSPSPASRRISRLQASSPIRLESDVTVDKLTEYFDWLMQGFPGKAKQLQECLTTLRSEEILFATVQDIPTELWKDWKISNGLILLVKGQMKKWEREQGRKR
jgi:hypothetical protein